MTSGPPDGVTQHSLLLISAASPPTLYGLDPEVLGVVDTGTGGAKWKPMEVGGSETLSLVWQERSLEDGWGWEPGASPNVLLPSFSLAEQLLCRGLCVLVTNIIASHPPDHPVCGCGCYPISQGRKLRFKEVKTSLRSHSYSAMKPGFTCKPGKCQRR